MGDKKDLKIHALIPGSLHDNKEVLEKVLKDSDCSIEVYESLDHFRKLLWGLKDLGSEELAFLFTNIDPSSDLIPSATASLAAPSPSAFVFHQIPDLERLSESKLDPMVKIHAIDILREHFLSDFPQFRNQLQLVLMLPRGSDFVNRIPKSVRYLAKPLVGPDSAYFINEWIEDFRKTALARRGSVQATLEKANPPLENDPLDFPIDVVESEMSAKAISELEDPMGEEAETFPTTPSDPAGQSLALRFPIAYPTGFQVLSPATSFHPFPAYKDLVSDLKKLLFVSPRPSRLVFRARFAAGHPVASQKTLETPPKEDSPSKPFPGETDGGSRGLCEVPMGPETSLGASPDPGGFNRQPRVEYLETQSLADPSSSDPLSEAALEEPAPSPASTPGTASQTSQLENSVKVIEAELNKTIEQLRISEERSLKAQQEVRDVNVKARKIGLRSEDREIAIQQVVSTYQHYLRALERIQNRRPTVALPLGEEKFYQFSEPARLYDSRALKLFYGNRPRHEMAPSTDYKIDRTLPEINSMMGVDVVALKNIAHQNILGFFKSSRIKSGKMNVLHVGPGKCSIFDEFPKAEQSIDSTLVSNHLGFARAILHSLPDLLERTLVPPPEHDKSGFSPETLKRFALHLNTLLLKYEGRDGRYQIHLGPAEDQSRLQNHVLRLAKNDEVKEIARRKRQSIEGTSGRYAKDKLIELTDEDQRCIRVFAKDPKGFFDRYFPGFFSEKTPEALAQLFGLVGREMIYGNFQDAQQILKNTGQFIGFGLDVKAASHLEDPQFVQFVHEIATHLVPGGIYLGNSHEESYTWHIRIDELRTIQEKLGDEYALYFICEDQKPLSFVILRGLPDPLEKGEFKFPTNSIQNFLGNTQLVRLDNFEAFAPETAFRNKVIWQTKYRFLQLYYAGLAAKKMRVEGTQTWRNACYEQIDGKISGLVRAYINPKSVHWRKLKEMIQTQGKKSSAKKGPHFFHRIIRDKYMDDFWAYAKDKHSFDLDTFIRDVLVEHMSSEEK
jgi:hypothetical protein